MRLDLRQNYFELFGLPEGYRIDSAALAERFRELQFQLHPDRYANATETERRLSVQGAAFVNEALATLKDPYRRARYLLTLRGVTFDDERETSSDPEFLMEQMELREALGEAREHDDPFARVAGLRADIRARREALEAEFVRGFEAGDLEAAKRDVLKMRFYDRLLEEAARLEERLEDELLSD